jgi:phytanoyl-CoA hydroxylase
MPNPLTREQIDEFNVQGFLKYGKILKDDELPALRDEYDRLFAEARKTGHMRNLSTANNADLKTQLEADTQMFQIMQMCERSIIYRRLVYDTRFLDIVENFIGANIMLFHDQALFKPAKAGGPVTWHQDNAYWRCRPANLVSMWLTLDDVDIHNGAMQVIPGSHLKPVWHDKKQSEDILFDVSKHIDTSKAVVNELPAGGCMFHHCQTLHYTAPNTTDRQRRAFIIHFMPIGTRSMAQDDRLFAPAFGHPVLRMGVA